MEVTLYSYSNYHPPNPQRIYKTIILKLTFSMETFLQSDAITEIISLLKCHTLACSREAMLQTGHMSCMRRRGEVSFSSLKNDPGA